MIDIQSATAEISRGKKEEETKKKERDHRAKIQWPALFQWTAIIKITAYKGVGPPQLGAAIAKGRHS